MDMCDCVTFVDEDGDIGDHIDDCEDGVEVEEDL